MAGHMWVAIQYTPIEVELADDGESLHTFTSEQADELARDDSALGCYICGQGLTTKSYHEVCPGSPN